MDTKLDRNKKKQIAKKATDLALEKMKGLSDFWIARTNPFDPAFRLDKHFNEVMWNIILELYPQIPYEDVAQAVQSGFLNAMQAEKENRMKAIVWNPYNKKPNPKA